MKKITGIILAGGRSSRMGSNKARIKIAGISCIERVMNALRPVAGEILIIADPAEYAGLGATVYPDILKEGGPLAGICTGLLRSATEENIFAPCDMPFLCPELYRHLLRISPRHEITIPSLGKEVYPLCGVYLRSCAGRLLECVKNRERKVKEVISRFRLHTEPLDAVYGLNDPGMLANLNTPQELASVPGREYEN